MAGPDPSGEWITLAVVIKTQGRRGEVAVESHTDIPDRFRQDMRLWALAKDGQRREVTVEDLWPHKSFLVLMVQGKEPKTKLPYEIPFAEAFLEKLDLEQRQVRMKLPEGLLEVNAPLS